MIMSEKTNYHLTVTMLPIYFEAQTYLYLII